ncbi:MAG: hypothetical protein HY001_01825, partial [Candidatus Portnoybacteria bacterium]|nr:hypothetical protein [Candidatus Portnoybacteria bacterium]
MKKAHRNMCIFCLRSTLASLVSGGIVLFLLLFPFGLGAQTRDPYEVNVNFRFSFRPVFSTITAPYRLTAFIKTQIQEQGKDISQKSLSLLRSPYIIVREVKEHIDEQGEDISQKSLSLFYSPYKTVTLLKGTLDSQRKEIVSSIERVITSPYRLAKKVKEGIDQAPALLASFVSKQGISNFQLPISNEIQNSNDQIPDTKYFIQNTNTKEIIREVVVKEQSNISNNSNDSNTSNQLSALRDELNQS